MNAPAAIAAQLVDMRNVGTHKVLRLTIHVPEEQALAAIAAFGWPTGVNPVPIAIARLNDGGLEAPGRLTPVKHEIGLTNHGGSHDAAEVKPATTPRQQKETAGGAKTAFRDMRLANQAGILCNEVPFRKFLNETKPYIVGDTPEDAACVVRELCGVKSRSDIRPRTPSGDRWAELVNEYRTWMHVVA